MHNLINLTSFSGSLCSEDDIIKKSIDDGLGYAIITEDSSLASSPSFNKKCIKAGLKSIHGSIVNIKDAGSLVIYAKNNQGFSELSNILSQLPKFEMGKKREIDSDVLIDLLGKSKDLLILDGFEGSVLDQEMNDAVRGFYRGLIKAMDGYDNILYGFNRNSSDYVKHNLKKLSESKIDKTKVFNTGISNYTNMDDKKAWFSLYLSKGYGRDKNAKKINDFKSNYALNNNEPLFSKMSNAGVFSEKFSQYNVGRSVDFPNLYTSNDKVRPLRKKVKDVWLKRRGMISEKNINVYEKRLDHELNVIESLDSTFEQYFLFYDSLSRGARAKGFEASIRGSAGGSLVLYVLGMSKADPMKYNLPFERFLFKGIEDFPDIDLDVSDKKGCIEMLADHYSDNYFAEIITNNTVNKATESIKIALSYYEESQEISASEIESFRKRTDNLFKYLKKGGDETKISHLIENNNFWKKEYNNPVSKIIFDDAIKIEGASVGRSVSVSSSVLSSTPLSGIMPVQDSSIELFSENCEDMGLLKIDILSSVMLKRINQVKRSIYHKWDKIDDDNKKIPLDVFISNPKNVGNLFRYMSFGYTEGVNQIGGDIGKFICKDIKPSNLSDLMVVLGLIRMGVNKNTKNFPDEYIKYKEGKQNPDSINYIHKDIKPILEETYGSIIFEEQIMEIAKKIGGFEPNDANAFRKCITKKKDHESLNGYFKDKFLKGSISRGYSQDDSLKIFEMLSQKINQFNFSKNHSANYAMIALSEMFLKYEYPSEFLNVYKKNTKDEESVLRVIEDFDSVGYKYQKPTLDMVFKKDPETINGVSTKLISQTFNGLVNEDFSNFHKDLGGDFDIDELVLNALPFYSSKSAMLISEQEKGKLLEDINTLIKSGFLDDKYSKILEDQNDNLSFSSNKELAILSLRYSLSNHLNKILNYRTDLTKNQNIDIESSITIDTIPEKDYSEFKFECTLKENEILGFSYLLKDDVLNLSQKNTRKPN